MNDQLVLVVEDEDTVRELEMCLLEQILDVGTIGASNGYEAIALASEHEPSLILLDIALPGMSGIQVAKELKANPATRHIPIIAVTASASRSAVEAVGCIAFVEKPFELRQLLDTVQAHLPSEKGPATRELHS